MGNLSPLRIYGNGESKRVKKSLMLVNLIFGEIVFEVILNVVIMVFVALYWKRVTLWKFHNHRFLNIGNRIRI